MEIVLISVIGIYKVSLFLALVAKVLYKKLGFAVCKGFHSFCCVALIF